MNKIINFKSGLFALIICLSVSLYGCGNSQTIETASSSSSSAATTVSTSSAASLPSEESSSEDSSEETAVVIDYGDAESFEAALNAGEDLAGKVVRFVAVDYIPDSAIGCNIWAGEHLNFVSDSDPGVRANDTVTVRVTDIERFGETSWIMQYEMADNAVEGESTITYSAPDDENSAADSLAESKADTDSEVSFFDVKKAVENGDYSLVTPEFKQTMDAYEAFYDDYIAFMRKYTSGQINFMEMLDDYSYMLEKMDEWSALIDSIDESELSPADDAYFLLVTLRIEQKLFSMF